MVVEFLVLFIDLAFTAGMTMLIPTGHYYHYWAPLLLLIAGYIVGVALMWGILSIYCQIYKKDKVYTKPSKIANFWLTQCIAFIDNHGGAKIRIKRNEPLPNGRFLLICNHISKFDPMILAAKFGRKYDLAFISKPTNFKIPIGGHLMAASCYLSIDRYDKLKSLEVMNKAIDLISNDYCSMCVFPEGTRGDNPHHMGPFHEGVFMMAKKANVPIVVFTIQGSEKIHKNFPKRTTKVDLTLLKVIYPNEYQDKTLKDISDYCYQIMDESIR